MISYLRGCLAYLDFIRDIIAESPSMVYILVVYEFSNVFPADLPKIPPDRDIDFAIDLKPGTKPICITFYHMALTELKKLKE